MNRLGRQVSSRIWLARSVLIAGLLAVGWIAVSRGLASALREAQPEAAVALAPSDTAALGAIASRMILGAKSAGNRQEAVDIARHIIERDPTSVAAIDTLAIDAEARGDLNREAGLFAYAQRLSRRDLGTQMYFIERAVAHGDVKSALRHYDIALRTSPEAQAIMFPVLQGTLVDPSLRMELAKLLATKPSWGPAFLATVATTGNDFTATLALLSDLRRIGAPPSPDVESSTLANLVSTHPDLAWRYYVSTHRGLNDTQPVNGGFDRANVDGSPFDWQLTADNGVQTVLERLAGRGVLSFSVPATAAGIVARQMRVLPPGTYRLETMAVNVAQPKESQPYWQIICADGRPLGSVQIGSSPERGRRFMGMFSVPGDCKTQWLQLVARPTDALSGVTGSIDWVSLARLK
ncbi:MAG: hypothetical protein ABIS14_11940 [Sphingomonas sp.]